MSNQLYDHQIQSNNHNEYAIKMILIELLAAFQNTNGNNPLRHSFKKLS